MSVNAVQIAKVDPIRRVLTETPGMVENPSIIARWYGAVQVTGDASGGVYELFLNIDAVDSLFPFPTLFDCRLLNLESPNGGLAGGYVWTRVAGADEGFLSGQNIRWYRSSTFSQYYSNDLYLPPMDWKFRLRQNDTGSGVYWYVGPNTNGYVLRGMAAGYIFQESKC